MNGNKSRSKVLKIAVGAPGVQSAGFTGKELDQLEVVGEGIDAVVLTSLLRKNVGPSDLISVGSAEKKEEKKVEILPVLVIMCSWVPLSILKYIYNKYNLL